MAEFKLGRIRFVWKDQWVTSTTYYVDDVIRFGGKTYICRQGHVANSNFYTDLNFNPTKWEQMSDGQAWKDDWSTSVTYATNDIVRYGGILYIANTPHTSAATVDLGLEQDLAKWDVYLEGLDWKDNWTTNTRYKKNDLVKYGGHTYVANQAHTSAATISEGLELDQNKWDIFNPGIEYKGNWTNGVRYKVNDVVKRGANIWIATSEHTSTASFIDDEPLYWETFVEGFEFENDWSESTVYQPGDIVRYGGNQYVSLTNHSDENPVTSTANWNLFLEGMRFEGEWDSATAYKIGSVVTVNGFSFIAVADSTNSTPPSVNWEQLNSGVAWQGPWTDANDYKIGDIVRQNSNAYYCVQVHTSEDEINDPASDTEGDFWNLFSIGTETAVLTTQGDLVYYSGSGPARLPIGRKGQVLRSNGIDPEWVTLGEIDQVYYVAPHGADEPAPIYGKTWDQPFKTIRYAAEQIEKGPRNPNAQYLLELNRVFLQKEITEYITYQVANATTGSIWENFNYDTQKCERDVGFVVDRLIWDIGHGGNLKIRAAVQALLGVLDSGPFSNEDDENGTGEYPNLSIEGEQSVESYTYLKNLIEDVLNNEAPSVNYQSLNNDLSTAVVDQYINLDIPAETTAFTEINSLLDVLITALDTQDPNTIPDRFIPNSTIFVATGQYNETLPIIVPVETSIVGDELRSTNVRPAGSLIDVSDSYYTIKTFDHFSDIVGDIVTGATITPTSGNTIIQNQEFPFADVAETEKVRQLSQVMKNQIDFRLDTLDTAFLTDPLSGFDSKARKLVKENKKFLQEEVIGFLIENYPTLRYGKTDTRRDVGYVVNAIIYDLTYGGNALSIQAGLSYFNAADDDQPLIPASIKQATLDALGHLKTRLAQVANNSTFDPSQTLIPQFRGTAGIAGDITLINNNLDAIIEIVDNGPSVVGTTVTLVDPTPANGVNSTTALINAYNELESNLSTVSAATVAFINSNYPTLVYSEVKAARDVEIVLKAVGYDFMFNSNYQTIKAAQAYLRDSVSSIYSSRLLKKATRDSLEFARTQAIINVLGNATAISRINTLMKLVDDIIFGGNNEGEVCQAEERNVYYANLQLERNREFIVSEIEAYIASEFSTTATATTDATNVITVSDTSWLRRNAAIKFTGTAFGNIELNKTYYVFDVVSSTQFKISETRFAPQELNLSDATGSLAVSLVYNKQLCLRDVGTYIDALKWDLVYNSNYKSRFVARYYSNAVIGSKEEDMYYLRNGTGIRNQTVQGLDGDLTPANEYGTSRVTAGAYVSLDPGWGPEDFRAWIISRSPYVQNVTTFGRGAIGQKIDGALHNGGNDSIVSNDFTQVISDGIGAWVANNARAELVSVFSYYAHIGYLSTEGGRIRGTNGNSSYGTFGAVAEGFDATETANTAEIDNLSQFEAQIESVFVKDGGLANFEFSNAGVNYTEVEYIITGGGVNAELENNEFRNKAVFEVRLLDLAPEGEDGMSGGFGYITNSNTAQGGTLSSISLAQTDPETDTAYIGMKVIITGGTGSGQFGIIDTYNSGTKVATVTRESDDQEGWDHVIPGTEIVVPDGSSTYTVEPALSFTAPPYLSATPASSPSTADYASINFVKSTKTYLAVTGTSSNGSGATFNVIKKGTKYRLYQVSGGTGYERLDTITIAGSTLNGINTTNDIVITVTSINAVTGAVTGFDFVGVGNGGNFIAPVVGTATAGIFNGTSWSTTTLPSSINWSKIANGEVLTVIAAGDIVQGSAYRIKTVGDTFFNALGVGATLNAEGEYFVAGPTVGTGTGTVTEVKDIAVLVANGSNSSAYSEDGGLTWTAGGNLPASGDWASVAYGQGRWVAIDVVNNTTAYSEDGGLTWTAGGNLPADVDWTDLTYGAAKFVAVASGTGVTAYSPDGGETWVGGSGMVSSNWSSVSFGNNRFVAVSSTSGTVAAYSLNGINWISSTLPATASWTDITYGQGVFVAVSSTTSAATSEDGILWTSRAISTSDSVSVAYGDISQVSSFVTISDTGTANTSIVSTGARAKARASVADNRIFSVRITEPGSNYSTAPVMTIGDPNEVFELPKTVRIGNGVLATPTFINRGTQFESGNADVESSKSDGEANFLQAGSFIAVRRITQRPVPGSNIVFGHLPDRTFKLVQVLTFRGSQDGSYTAFYQISPPFTTSEAPANNTSVETRIRYSQVRLTGHDFLSIGTGNFENTNYPGTFLVDPIPLNEVVENNGGRVFYTSTDQDGNFRVGDLFSIEQSTGIATLNADAFNIAGLQELNLGNVTLGGGSATVTEFSTDPFFTANSDNIVPTQRAIRAYIAAQIGGGGATLNVNKIIAGNVEIGTNQIKNITGAPIKMAATFEFRGGVIGYPIAWNYFLN
jgi:hypothetical protein